MSQHVLMQKNSRFTSDKAKHAKILRGVSSLVNSIQLKLRAWLSPFACETFWRCASITRTGCCSRQLNCSEQTAFVLSFGFSREIRRLRATNSCCRLTFWFGLIFPELLKIRALSRSALDTRSRDWRHIKWMFFSLSNITESRSC